MKLRRIQHRWRVLSESCVLHDCLEHLVIQKGFRVSEVSSELGVTEQHFRRIFQRDVGIPIKKWMRQERMVIARRMFCCDIPQELISDTLGFAHINSFQREFKAIYEMTVSDFLKTRERRIDERLRSNLKDPHQ